MKTLYKVLPMMLGVGLFGCSNANNATTQDNVNTNSTAAIKDNNAFVSKLPDTAPTVKLSTDAQFAPYGFNDEYGSVTGFDIDLMREIGEDQGFKVEIYSDPWEEVFDNLDNKTRDMLAAAVPYSTERDKKYLLSDPYAPLPSSLVYLDESLNLTSVEELDDVKIGVLSDTVQYDYFSSGEISVESVSPYPSTFLAVKAMARGEVDAVAEDAGALRYLMNDLPDLEPKYFDYEDIHAESAYKVLLVEKGQPELLEKVNAGLKSLKQNGTYATLTTKWFGEDLTQAVSEQRKPNT
ncbi:transporter substrate-binding domain-containing protein [Psychrobacter sp. FBL11]|uniref:Transporter substrate-binding domain-containing protein n=1 Tax=Psychrobacter saeujeotis TaxID=3143436 RepID=A0ABU9X9R4_9GAMM|nr:transporter substrate-binding domain-containing protein [uncultured Psychrobacter sp.]